MPFFSNLEQPAYLLGYMGFVAQSNVTPAQSAAIQHIQLAEQFGWTWEYIDNLPIEILGSILSYNSGLSKGQDERSS